MKKRKILVFTGYRSEYIKIKTVLDEIKVHPGLEMEIVALGAHSLLGFGSTVDQIRSDGFTVSHCLKTNVEGSGPAAMSNSIGLIILQVTPILESVNPDVVLCAADRYEIFAAVVAAAVNNFPVAHVQGGEVSGTIDESFRHAMTKLSHIHFPSTELSAQRIIRMGEDPSRVFNVGCPSIDYINQSSLLTKEQLWKKYSLDKNFLLVVQHAVTTEYKDAYHQMLETLNAVVQSGYEFVLIYPNPDAGSDEIRRAIRVYDGKTNLMKGLYKTLPFEDYLGLLKYCDAIVGNSSSGIREAHIFGTSAIDVGTRQQGRESTPNVFSVGYDHREILKLIRAYAGKNNLSRENPYGDGTAGKKIAGILSEIDLSKIQKRLSY